LIRVVSLLDSAWMTGPAKNLTQFCLRANSVVEDRIATEVSIATIYRTGGGTDEPTNPFIAGVRAAGIHLDVITERYRYDPRVVDQLKEVIRQHNPAIIETHGTRMHFLARFSGLSRTIPWVAFHHGYTAEDLKMRAYNQVDRWSLRAAKRIFTDCGPFADHLAGFGIRRERIRVLGSSIEKTPPASPEEIRALGEELRIRDGERLILSVGRLSKEKAHSDLVAAAAYLVRTRPQLRFRLVLVGDGPERGRLEAAVAAAGLSGIVVFAGLQKNVRPYYGLADLLALPSISEGSPNVLLEAMAADVPIVSTAVGGVPEMLVHDWSGLLVPARKPELFALQMERLMNDPALAARLASNAAITVADRFSPDSYCRTVVEAYSELSSSSR